MDNNNKSLAKAIRSIGKAVQRERNRSHMSQEVLAFESGLTVTTISKIERIDVNNVSIKTLVRIADALGIDLISLVWETD